jgi:hypothetical protein
MKAISINPFVIKYVKDQNYFLCMKAIELNPFCIIHIDESSLTFDMCERAYQIKPHSILFIKNNEYIERLIKNEN